MNRAEKLRADLGHNVTESLGNHSGPVKAMTAGSDPRRVDLKRIRGSHVIPIELLRPDPDQPREDFEPEALEQLSQSLKEIGQLQPIRVRPDPDDDRGWIIISGERRYRAAVLAGLPTLQAVEDGTTDPDEILDQQLVENCLRDDLKPIEQARAFRSLMDRRGWTQAKLAAHLHIHQSSIARAVGLLKLPEDLQEQVDSGALPETAAHRISRMDDGEEAQREVAARIVNGSASRADLKPRKTPAKRPMHRTFKVVAGWQIMAEPKRGAKDAGLAEALRSALARIEGEGG